MTDLDDWTVLIPARTGSVRIPQKNFRPLHQDGRCATQLAIDCALKAGFRRIVVSTDQAPPFIAAVAWDRRPDALAQAETPMIEVVRYLIGAYDTSYYLLVQPTQPLRQPRHLKQAVAQLLNPHRHSVVSIGLDRFVRDGTAYAFCRSTVMHTGTIYGTDVGLMGIPGTETCPLDTPAEWDDAKRRLSMERP